MNETIYAVCTGWPRPLMNRLGRATGVAVIRISGSMAPHILQLLSNRSNSPPKQLSFTKLYSPRDQSLLDLGMSVWFPAPNSFTGEHVVELHLHGGVAVVQGVLDALGYFAPSCRPAEPGEFIKRAFEAGKMDLAKVDALADLLNAETEVQRKVALMQVKDISQLYQTWREELISMLAYLEADIDFGEDEDLEGAGAAESIKTRIRCLYSSVLQYLSDARRGERLRNGFRLALVGPPNVGKSTLFNTLVQRNAAIVSPIAGTTRDVLESHLDLGGFPVILFDTAGIQDTNDLIELEGINRALKRYTTSIALSTASDPPSLDDADLAICVLDASLDLSSAYVSFIERINKPKIVVFNKWDLLSPHQQQELQQDSSLKFKQQELVYISCLEKIGLSNFFNLLTNRLPRLYSHHGEEGLINGAVVITNERHRHHLGALVRSLDGALQKADIVLMTEEIRQALREIARITGRIDVDDVLDVIFKQFCIGK